MQNTITNIDKQRFTPFTVGFDDLFDRLFDMEVNTSSGYPPYNIIKSDDYNYHIEIAVAGFNKDQKANETQNIIHQGISQRNFVRKFTLSDEIRVKSADLNDGMLKIKLEKVIPEHKKPKLITIK